MASTQEPTSSMASPALDLIRARFIQKVYALFGASIMMAAVGVFTGLGMSPSLYLPVTLLALVVMIGAFYFQKSYPINLVLLFGFTFLNGLAAGPILGAIGAAGYEEIIAQALFATSLTMGSLTLYVFWSGKDFSFLGGFLFAGLIALLGFALVGMLFGFSAGTHLAMSYFAVLLFVGFVLYDTSNIIRHYPPDTYVAATIALFLDFVNLFWALLHILLAGAIDE